MFKQVEKTIPSFKFFGAVCLDFSDHSFYKVNKINIKQLKENKIDKFGMIVNLDKLWQPGSHWVSLYCD